MTYVYRQYLKLYEKSLKNNFYACFHIDINIVVFQQHYPIYAEDGICTKDIYGGLRCSPCSTRNCY